MYVHDYKESLEPLK